MQCVLHVTWLFLSIFTVFTVSDVTTMNHNCCYFTRLRLCNFWLQKQKYLNMKGTNKWSYETEYVTKFRMEYGLWSVIFERIQQQLWIYLIDSSITTSILFVYIYVYIDKIYITDLMHVHVLMVHGFILRDQAVSLPGVKMKVLQSTDISGNILPATQCHIQEDWIFSNMGVRNYIYYILILFL
jgi:hypothetical protein